MLAPPPPDGVNVITSPSLTRMSVPGSVVPKALAPAANDMAAPVWVTPATATATAIVPVDAPSLNANTRASLPFLVAMVEPATGVAPIDVVRATTTCSLYGRLTGRAIGGTFAAGERKHADRCYGPRAHAQGLVGPTRVESDYEVVRSNTPAEAFSLRASRAYSERTTRASLSPVLASENDTNLRPLR